MPTDQNVEIDVNTDNLEDFNQLLHGKATPVATAPAPEAKEPKEAVTPADDTGANEQADDRDLEEALADVDANEADADADLDEEKDEEEEDILAKPKPKKQTVQERINELTRKIHEAERRAEAAERKAIEKEAAQAKPVEQPNTPPAQAQQPAADPQAPHPEQLYADGTLVYPMGEFDPKYIAALTAYTYDKRDREVQAQRAQEAAQQAQTKADTDRFNAWEAKVKEAETEIADLRPVIKTLDGTFNHLEPSYGTYLAQTIMDMELGPQVLFYLANHVDEAREIAASGAQRATLALGKLEARIQSALANKNKAAPARHSNAPVPPKTVTRGNGAARTVAADTDDLEAFERQFFKKK